MNPFLITTKKAIARNGLFCDYKSVYKGDYDVETGSVTDMSSVFSIKTYPKQIVVNQYNYPNMIGKEIVEFYIAGDGGFYSKPTDEVTYKGSTYIIFQIRETVARGEIVLFRSLAVKS